MAKTWNLLAAGLGLTALAACAEEASKPILVAQLSPHFIVTRGGLALPSGQMLVEKDTPEEYAGVFDNGDSTLEVRARFERGKSYVGTAEFIFDGTRKVSASIDYVTGEVAFVAENVRLSATDVANLARVQIALASADAELGTPRQLVDGLVNFVGMVPAESLLGSFTRSYPTLALFDLAKGKMRKPVADTTPEPATPADVAAYPGAQAANPFFLLLPPEEPPEGGGGGGGGGGGSTYSVWLLRPAYTGPFIGTGGTGIKCVSEGYYYPIGYDWRRRIFSTRHIVNTWAPVMPRGYTSEQAYARDGFTCHGLAGPNCNWDKHRWTNDPLRHDDCVRKQNASSIVSVKCGDEFADSFDDATIGTGHGCLGGPGNTYSYNRISFMDWAPHYEGQPSTCGNGQVDPGETTANCEVDVPEPATSGSCGDTVCNDLNETSASCPADCLATTCSNGVCEAGETAANCADDCVVCGDGTCQSANGETYSTCPSDCAAPVCGDGTCSGGETASTCIADCRKVLNPLE